jgi:hypothetical protein
MFTIDRNSVFIMAALTCEAIAISVFLMNNVFESNPALRVAAATTLSAATLVGAVGTFRFINRKQHQNQENVIIDHPSLRNA